VIGIPLKEVRMHWKKRQKQIQYLQAKHGCDRSLAREFPDLKVEQLTAPCSKACGAELLVEFYLRA
jgi:hypothetical protein